jgi:superfamily I DNA and/or RNA helicase
MSDFSSKTYWDGLLDQLSHLSTQFGLIPPESDYHKMGQDFQESLRLLLIDAWKGASPLNRFSAKENRQQPAEEAPQPEVPVKRKKERYKPTAKPYFSEQEEPERMEQLFTQLYAQCSRADDKKNMHLNGMFVTTSDFLGCLFMACMNNLKNDERFNIKAFFNLFEKIKSQLGKACPVIVTYSAVQKKLKTKKILGNWVEDYDKSTEKKFSAEREKAKQKKGYLTEWTEINKLVLEEGRAVGLFPSATPPKK